MSALALGVAALAVAAAVAWAGHAVARELTAEREETRRGRVLQLLTLLAPGVAAAGDNPRALLTWQPLAATARKLFPDEFASIDLAAGTRFPFSAGEVQAAHARWTAEWLAWERAHDAEFKHKVAAAERDLATGGDNPVARAWLDSIEREKLESYQRRYEEYIRVGRALQALLDAAGK